MLLSDMKMESKMSASDVEFDYIVVGAGSSGCVVASRLSEDRATNVLLIEAGPDGKSWQIDMPLGVEALVSGSEFNWQYKSEPEAHLSGRQIEHPRGKVLGGSSSINGMVYTRGHALDYDGWANEFDCKGWSYAEVLPYFKRSETFLGDGDEYRGKNGPLRVSRPDLSKDPLNRAFMAAGIEAGYPTTSDSNAFQQEGFGPNECTIWGGVRWSAAQAFLSKDVRRRSNLTIYTDSLVERILIKDKVATGVQILKGGRRMHARARREIVVCAGAFGSPQLLQLSGIGPNNILKAAGIDVVHELDGVGHNLQDHPDLTIQYRCSEPVGLGSFVRFPLKQMIGASWFLFKSGPAASNQFESAAYIRTKAGVRHPDMKLELLPLAFQPDSFVPYTGHSFQIHMTLLRAESRGTVSVRSSRASEKPMVSFNYLSSPADREAYRNAVRLTREIVAQPAFDRYRGQELAPGSAVQTDADLDKWVAQRVATAFHPAGTCKMGPKVDEQAVVTPELKVHGIGNLRVADASIMPQVVSSNTNAPSIMIGERAADLIRGVRLLPESKPFYISPAWEVSQR